MIKKPHFIYLKATSNI